MHPNQAELDQPFADFDRQMMRWIVGAGMVLAVYTFGVIYTVKHSDLVGWMQSFVIVPSAFSSVFVFYCLMTRVHRKKAISLGLVCCGCQQTLVEPNLTLSSGHPDWRADGVPPNRCPHCQLGIYRAWDSVPRTEG